MGHQSIPRQPVYARSRRKASRVKEKLYLDQQHKKKKKTCTVFLHCLGWDGVTSSLSVPPLTLMIFFTSSSIAFSSHFFLPPSCSLVHQTPDLILISILCLQMFINRIRNAIMDFGSYFPLYISIWLRMPWHLNILGNIVFQSIFFTVYGFNRHNNYLFYIMIHLFQNPKHPNSNYLNYFYYIKKTPNYLAI